ncbi:hypothetical protein AAG570_003367 [Ranatra chinensis]|uniref:RHD domain-containing protein n=1 Tax=Ranatra chinensis TaxID=642074 RepID=A0ABD0Y4N1_9HEMI
MCTVEVIKTDPAFGQSTGSGVRRTSQETSGACVKIIEQPASKALRFRYECEGRSAGSIPGVNSTSENKTYPTIQIEGYVGRAVVVVSCVTKDHPYKPHPHNLVGKEGCKKGVCTVEVNNETMITTFANLGIQCVKRKDIEEALRIREEIRVDPFRTGFSHRTQPSSIDLNSVRLCFQAFLEGPQRGKFTIPLQPIVSEPIYDKKAMADLVICKLSHCSGSVAGGNEIILLCEKVAKEDISVRFYEEKDGQIVWEGFGDFTPTQVHKQVAISFRTPRYRTIEIDQPVKVLIQLRRPSDGATSEALPFQLTPLDSGRPPFWMFRRNIGQKADYRTFADILQSNTQLLTHKTPVEVIDLDEKQDANNNKSLKTEEITVTEPEKSPREEMEQEGIDELLEQVKNLENMYPENGNDFGVYSSLQMAMKNPCDMADFSTSESYEDIAPPPRPAASKPTLAVVKEGDVGEEDDSEVPPLPPKRVRKMPNKTLPPVPHGEKSKLNIFQKLFSSSRHRSKKAGGKSREGSVVSETVVVEDDRSDLLTEAEHYALYTSVAPHATASEFDEMSFYYSPVEGQKVN